MQTVMDDALRGVSQAVQLAHRAQQEAELESSECRLQAEEWRKRYEQEREKAARLKAQLAERNATPSASPASLLLPPRSQSGVQRRHTVPAGGLADSLKALQLAGTAPLPLQAEPSETGSSGDGFSLARLGAALAACVLLPRAVAAAGVQCGPHLTRQLTEGGEHATVSVADDGSSGVGATAAAAVSVALAQSWAAVAGGKCGKQDSPRPGAMPAHPGKARFKLVAAVPRNHKRSGRVPGTSPQRDTPGDGATSSAGLDGGPSRSPSRQSGFPGGDSSSSHLALESLDDARVLDDAQEANWRSSGSHLKLQWLSAPSTVLVVCKPSAEVVGAAGEAVAWLVRRGITVLTEPGAHAELAAEAAAALQDGGGLRKGLSAALSRSGVAGSMDSATAVACTPPDSSPAHTAAATAAVNGTGPGESAAPRRLSGGGGLSFDPEIEDSEELLGRLLLTWGADARSWAGAIPAPVADRIDLVVTFGGDGTVLWACSLFTTGPVPPVVPFAMGSLGFMTPFPISRMGAVLARVTSVEHSFPLMLRHRLQARILHAGASATDLASPAAAPCGEDVCVLNEVVIDRGPAASLANLQCYVDHNFVTTIQGDGLIVATPTGSTAYNLAAGGSMVHPSVPCVLFTPICPHTLSSRPLVFPEHVTLRVKVPADSRSEAYCSFDGKGRRTLRPGDSVLIHLSQWPVPMVCNLDASHDWFLSVREGLNWNRRQAQRPAGQ